MHGFLWCPNDQEWKYVGKLSPKLWQEMIDDLGRMPQYLELIGW
jgi:hypothetical protein